MFAKLLALVLLIPTTALSEGPTKTFIQGLSASGSTENRFFSIDAFEELGNTGVSFSISETDTGDDFFCNATTESSALRIPDSAQRGLLEFSFTSEQCFDGVARTFSVECVSDGSFEIASKGHTTIRGTDFDFRGQGSNIFTRGKCTLLFEGEWVSDLNGILQIIKMHEFLP